MHKPKKKYNPKARSAAAKKLLSKRMSKKNMVTGNGTKDGDRVPNQPESADQNREMMES
jgi:hypothetical protein